MITGKDRHFVCDTITERDSILDSPFLKRNLRSPEGIYVFVKYPDFTDESDGLIGSDEEAILNGKLYIYTGGAFQLSSPEVTGGDDLPDTEGHEGHFLQVNEVGVLQWVALAGGGDLLSTNNLSDLDDPEEAKANLGLDQVDNTSDLDKPISDLTQDALDDKVDKVAGKGLSENDFTDAHKDKVDFISVSQSVDLDAIESRVNDLDAAVVLKGTWDASGGSFPGAGAAQAGWSYIVSVAGTVDSVDFIVGDRIIAITDNALIGTFAANWFKADYTDQVLSVNGLTGAVSLTTANVPDSSNKRYVTDAQQTVIDNTSNTNTGDETAARIGAIVNGAAAATPNDTDLVATVESSVVKKITWTNVKAFLKTYFDALYQTLLVSGTNIKTINSTTLLGSGNISISGGDIVYAPTPADVAINNVADQTIFTKDLTGIAAGDQIVMEGEFVILNNSTANRVYVITLDFDNAFDIEITTGSLAFSATLMHPVMFRAVCNIRSTSLAYMVVSVDTQLAAGIASGTDTTVAATHLSGKGWGETASNLTGTLTCNLKIRSANGTATQTCRLVNAIIRKTSPVG